MSCCGGTTIASAITLSRGGATIAAAVALRRGGSTWQGDSKTTCCCEYKAAVGRVQVDIPERQDGSECELHIEMIGGDAKLQGSD